MITPKALAIVLALFAGNFMMDAFRSEAAVTVDRNVNEAVNDSISGAFAVVWAEYLRQEIPTDTVAASKFLEGLAEAFSVKAPMDQYYRGVLVGMSIAERLEGMQSMGMPVDGSKTIEILSGLLSGKMSPNMASSRANEYLNNYVAKKMSHKPDTVSSAAEQAFIDGVAKMDGAVKLPSGVVMITMIDGVGESPLAGEDVMVSYEGRLSDGTVFDSTEEPIAMTVGKLVPGFNQGLLKMKPGGTYRIVIPAELGYGAEGIPGVIPGNAALDFTVSLQ